MKCNNYYQKIIVLVLACFFQVSFASQGYDFSVNINGTHIELLPSDAECPKPETQNALDLDFSGDSYSGEKRCRYQVTNIHSITSNHEAPVYFGDHSSEHLQEYAIIFYFRTPSVPAEFLTAGKPDITYSKDVHCHSQFEPSLQSYLTSCLPESNETLTGTIRYDGDMWLQPPGECLTRENHQGFMLTVQPETVAAANTKLITSATLAETLSHIRTTSMIMDLDHIDLDLPKGVKSGYFMNTNRFVQINGLFSCCFSCFRPRTQTLTSAITIRRWEDTDPRPASPAHRDFSRGESSRSITSDITMQYRPPTPGGKQGDEEPESNNQADPPTDFTTPL